MKVKDHVVKVKEELGEVARVVFVIPAKAGVQLDPRLRENDEEIRNDNEYRREYLVLYQQH